MHSYGQQPNSLRRPRLTAVIVAPTAGGVEILGVNSGEAGVRLITSAPAGRVIGSGWPVTTSACKTTGYGGLAHRLPEFEFGEERAHADGPGLVVLGEVGP